MSDEMRQSPMFPLSQTQRDALSRELSVLVCRYRAIEAEKKQHAADATALLKEVRKAMEAHAQLLYETDEEAQRIDIDALLEDLRRSEDNVQEGGAA